MHNAFRVENTVDLRNVAVCGIWSEVMRLFVPVFATAEKTPAKQVADGMPTHMEFSPRRNEGTEFSSAISHGSLPRGAMAKFLK